MEIIYVGGNGQLASYLRANTDFIITSRDPESKYYVDLSDVNSSKILDIKNHLIIIGAAISKPSDCEKNQLRCKKINYEGTQMLISKLLKNNKVVFLSSDLVFDGSFQDKPLSESSVPEPFSLYSKLKVSIENEFINQPNFYILRLSYVLFENNSFTNYLENCLKNDYKAEIIHPLIRHCTDPILIIEFILELQKNNKGFPKIKHLSGAALSRLDLLNVWKTRKNVTLDYELMPIEQSAMKDYPSYINFITELK